MITILEIYSPSSISTVSILPDPCRAGSPLEKNQRKRRKQRNYLTADKAAQASLLGAKIVKLPGPSISGLRLERSE